MKYAICNELYGDWTYEKAFSHARACGYEGLEIAPFTIHPDATKIRVTERDRVRRLAEKNQLEIIGLHWLLAKTKGFHLTHPDRDVRANTAHYLTELARLCHDLGGRIMVFGSPGQRNLVAGLNDQQATDHAVEVFQRIAEDLENLGVTLALEPLGPEEGDFMLTAASAIEVARRVNSPMVRLHLDVKAMSTESKTIPEIIAESRDWLVHFHANDPNRQGPGMGNVDFEPIFMALREINYDDWISVEVFDYSPGIDVLARKSIQNLKAAEANTS